MRAPNDSDEDSGSKRISKKETRMLLAINASESVLIESMIAEMRNDGNSFDVEKFIEVFRKYTPHFSQMLSGDKSDDSDDEDERPLPNKYFSFLTAFSKSSDKFISAIEKNYKVLYKKDLKEINFSVFKSHPEEIFKSYEKSIGHANHSSSVAVHESHANVPQSCNSVRSEEEEKTSILGTVDDYFTRMKTTNISVDTDHGSLLSAQEEELRKTIESESDTPTPTIEDWCGVSEKRILSEWTNDDMSKSHDAAPDAVPITVPPVGEIPMCNEPRTLSSHSTLPKNGIHSSNSHATLSTPQLKSDNRVANIDDQVNALMNGLEDIMREVHQDLRFALPPMIERAVRSYLKDRGSLTLRELIGEEYADERLEKFMVRMLSKDTALMQILELEFIEGADSLVHLGNLITKDLNRNNKKGDEKHREEEVEDTKENQVDATIAPGLKCIDYVNFYPESSQHLKDVEVDMNDKGTLVIVLSKLNVIVDNHLKNLRELDTNHLKLSNAHTLEKGKAVVLKSDGGNYCRGMVQEEWARENGKVTVKCLLVDYAQSCDIPIDLIYAFPKCIEPVPPATMMLAKLKVYPRGATRKTDTFSPSGWKAIGDVLNEWSRNLLSVCIISREAEDDKFVIDITNENEESLIDDLVEKGLAQKDLTPHLDSTSNPALSLSPDSSSSQPLAQPRSSLFSLNSANGMEIREEERKEMAKVSIPDSVNVLNECGSVMNAPPSSLIVKREQSGRREFIEIPSTAATISSLLQFVPQPVQVTTPPTVLGLNSRRFERGLVQILDDDE